MSPRREIEVAARLAARVPRKPAELMANIAEQLCKIGTVYHHDAEALANGLKDAQGNRNRLKQCNDLLQESGLSRAFRVERSDLYLGLHMYRPPSRYTGNRGRWDFVGNLFLGRW